MTACILNPSDDLGNYLILLLFLGTDTAGSLSIFIS